MESSVESDLLLFLRLLIELRERTLKGHDGLTWKTIYSDAAFQEKFPERCSSCLTVLKARKLVRFAAPRLLMGDHDDIVVTVLWNPTEGGLVEPLTGSKAQERHSSRLTELETSRKSEVERRREAVSRAKEIRSTGLSAPSRSSEIIEVVEEIIEEEIVEDDAEPIPEPMAPSTTRSDMPKDEVWDAPPPPPPPVDQDDEDWDAPPPPPPPLDDDGWDAPPPPPPPLADDDVDGEDDSGWDAPPPPPPDA